MAPQNVNERLHRGGLAEVTSRRGGSKTHFALSCLSWCFKKEKAIDPPLSPFEEKEATDGYYLFVADNGFLYPPALKAEHDIPLSRLLLVKAPEAKEVWRVGLEAVQTGLFPWVFLRPSRPTSSAQLRKLQLAAEKTRTRVFLLLQTKLPHWMLKVSYEAGDGADSQTGSVFSSREAGAGVRGGMSFAHAEGVGC